MRNVLLDKCSSIFVSRKRTWHGAYVPCESAGRPTTVDGEWRCRGARRSASRDTSTGHNSLRFKPIAANFRTGRCHAHCWKRWIDSVENSPRETNNRREFYGHQNGTIRLRRQGVLFRPESAQRRIVGPSSALRNPRACCQMEHSDSEFTFLQMFYFLFLKWNLDLIWVYCGVFSSFLSVWKLSLLIESWANGISNAKRGIWQRPRSRGVFKLILQFQTREHGINSKRYKNSSGISSRLNSMRSDFRPRCIGGGVADGIAPLLYSTIH